MCFFLVVSLDLHGCSFLSRFLDILRNTHPGGSFSFQLSENQYVYIYIYKMLFASLLQEAKKKYDKETEKYCAVLEKHLSLSARKKESHLHEVRCCV